MVRKHTDCHLRSPPSWIIVFVVLPIAFLCLLSMFGINQQFQSFLPSAVALPNGSAHSTNTPAAPNGSIRSPSTTATITNNIPSAKSLYETGIMSVPPTAKGLIIYIPDEAHHLLSDNKTMSLKNAHYIPSNLVVPAGTTLAFVHGDPNHIHVEVIKDNATGKVAWQTTPITHPGSSDTKVLPPGSYSVSDLKYAPMTGTIKVESSVQSNGNLVIGGFFCPTPSLEKYKADFTAAGFQILSEHDFLSKVVQKDIAGPTTLIIYSTTMPIENAVIKLKPLVASLPYL